MTARPECPPAARAGVGQPVARPAPVAHGAGEGRAAVGAHACDAAPRPAAHPALQENRLDPRAQAQPAVEQHAAPPAPLGEQSGPERARRDLLAAAGAQQAGGEVAERPRRAVGHALGGLALVAQQELGERAHGRHAVGEVLGPGQPARLRGLRDRRPAGDALGLVAELGQVDRAVGGRQATHPGQPVQRAREDRQVGDADVPAARCAGGCGGWASRSGSRDGGRSRRRGRSGSRRTSGVVRGRKRESTQASSRMNSSGATGPAPRRRPPVLDVLPMSTPAVGDTDFTAG